MVEEQERKQMIEFDPDNNLDLNKEQMKEILLKEIKIGQTFYPSDIAHDRGLDLMVVGSG